MSVEPSVSLGIDVAMPAKGLDLVAYGDGVAVPLLVRSHVAVHELPAVVDDLRPAIIAIDSPPRRALSGSSRECERLLAREGISSYATPSGPERFVPGSFYAWMAAGFDAFQAVSPTHPTFLEGDPAATAIEVFPHATAYVLAGGAEPKPKGPWRRRLVQLLGYETHLLRTGDHVDAALAALTGLMALRGGTRAVGDPREVIMIPAASLPASTVVSLKAEFADGVNAPLSESAGTIEVRLRGVHPVPWGAGAAEWSWREALANAVRARAQGSARPPRGAKVYLVATFYLLDSRAAAQDLDNLAKPLMDTLFRPAFTQAPNPAAVASALSDSHDGMVFSLALSKVGVSDVAEAGIDLQARW